MITLSETIQPNCFTGSQWPGPTALCSSTRTALDCQKTNVPRKDRQLSYGSRLARIPSCLCTAGEHQWECSFVNRKKESCIYAYKYDVGHRTHLNMLYGLRCHSVRKHKKTANSRLLILRNLRLVNY